MDKQACSVRGLNTDFNVAWLKTTYGNSSLYFTASLSDLFIFFFASTFVWAAHWSILTLAAADLLYIPTFNNSHLKDDIKKIEIEKENRVFAAQTEMIYL